MKIGNDMRDVVSPRSTIGVILETKAAGAILVATEWGILSHGSKKQEFWFSSE